MEHGRVGVPVLAEHTGAGVLQETVQRRPEEEEVVHVPDAGEEVRQEVGREEDVGHDEAEERLVEPRHPRVAEQPVEQPQEVGEVEHEGRGDAQGATAPPPEEGHRLLPRRRGCRAAPRRPGVPRRFRPAGRPRRASAEQFTPRLCDAVEHATGRTEQRHRPAHDPGRDGTGAHPVFHALGEPLQATRLGRRPRSVLGLQELDEVQDLVELLVGKCFELPPETLAHDVVHGPRLRAAPARRGAPVECRPRPAIRSGRVDYATPAPPVSPRPGVNAFTLTRRNAPAYVSAGPPSLRCGQSTGRCTSGVAMAFLPLRPVDLPAATSAAYERWVGAIAEELSDPNCDRNELCRRILTDIYYPQYRDADPRELPEPTRIALLQMDP